MEEIRIKEELAELLGKRIVNWAFRQECRNAALAGAIDDALAGADWLRANQLLEELGPDEFEAKHEEKFRVAVNTAEDARRFWKKKWVQ